MKCGVITVITLIALILSVSMWPLGSGLASTDLAHDAAAGMITNASTSTSGLLQLAKHDNGESGEGDEEGEHRHHHGHGGRADQHFCGPYFKSSSVPYFRDYYSRDDYANLPPGLRKHVLKTGHLPPGLEKKYESTGSCHQDCKRGSCADRRCRPTTRPIFTRSPMSLTRESARCHLTVSCIFTGTISSCSTTTRRQLSTCCAARTDNW
jgi:hypothetical protein